MNIAVCDTSSLIKLRRGGVLKCLGKIYDTIYIPGAVKNECKDKETKKEIDKPFFKVQHVKSLLDFHTVMGRGECEAISLARELQTPTIIIDDIQAYGKAEAYGLEPLTSFEILRIAKNIGCISSVKSILDTMIENGEGVEEALYQKTLREVNEL